jgi:hypothetical protein
VGVVAAVNQPMALEVQEVVEMVQFIIVRQQHQEQPILVEVEEEVDYLVHIFLLEVQVVKELLF